MNDEYQESDLAWMDMKTDTLDIVIGSIETYEDHIFGNKASHEAYVLIDESQRKYITFDAFFANTMFHEVAHGLGIKNTLNGNGKGKVRNALKEYASVLEEGKADVLGLYMI